MRITDNTQRLNDKLTMAEIRIDFEGVDLNHAINMAFSATDEIAKLIIKNHKDGCNCLRSQFARLIEWHYKQIHEEMKTIIVQKDHDTEGTTPDISQEI